MNNALPADLEWIFFDLDGTLWDHETACDAAIAELCTAHGLCQESFPGIYREANLACWQDLSAGRLTVEQMRLRRFQDAFARVGRADLAAQAVSISEAHLQAYLRTERLLPSAAEVVLAVTSRFRVAVVTNGFADTQEVKCSHLGAALDSVDFLHCAHGEWGLKPQPRFYRAALRRAGNPPPHQVLMVGDSWHEDIAAPRELGFRTAWISRGRALPDEDAAGVLVLESAAELLHLLQKNPAHP